MKAPKLLLLSMVVSLSLVVLNSQTYGAEPDGGVLPIPSPPFAGVSKQ
jgi:hypothetical protein